jgi:fructose/tagatose bisphosphate aldolase
LNKEVTVHSLAQASAALAAAAALKRPVALASAPGAAMQAGPAWFKSVIDQACAAHPDAAVTAILDCGDEAGAVMAGLRAGLKHFRFAGSQAMRQKLAAMGAEFAAPAASTLDLHDARQPEAAVRAFLERD